MSCKRYYRALLGVCESEMVWLILKVRSTPTYFSIIADRNHAEEAMPMLPRLLVAVNAN